MSTSRMHQTVVTVIACNRPILRSRRPRPSPAASSTCSVTVTRARSDVSVAVAPTEGDGGVSCYLANVPPRPGRGTGRGRAAQRGVAPAEVALALLDATLDATRRRARRGGRSLRRRRAYEDEDERGEHGVGTASTAPRRRGTVVVCIRRSRRTLRNEW